MYSFKTVPVFVTGAGRGIGKRLAIGFATRGARVGLLARSKAELDLCHLEIEHAGGSALRLRADTGDYEQVTAAVERMRVQFGAHPQVLICSAAILGPIGPFVGIESQDLAGSDPDQSDRRPERLPRGACRTCWSGAAARSSSCPGGGSTPARPNFAAARSHQDRPDPFRRDPGGGGRRSERPGECLAPGERLHSHDRPDSAAGERAGWQEIEEAKQVRMTGGVAAEKQIDLALFLASEQSNHISGRLIHVQDDWKKLRDKSDQLGAVPARRVQTVFLQSRRRPVQSADRQILL